MAGLCAKPNPSFLRSTSKEQLIDFWEKLHEKMKERAPIFLHILNASISNPSQSRNINKHAATLLAPMLNTGSELVSIFNEDMNAVRRIKSIILKKGGFKKHLSSVHLHYMSVWGTSPPRKCWKTLKEILTPNSRNGKSKSKTESQKRTRL